MCTSSGLVLLYVFSTHLCPLVSLAIVSTPDPST